MVWAQAAAAMDVHLSDVAKNECRQTQSKERNVIGGLEMTADIGHLVQSHVLYADYTTRTNRSPDSLYTV